MTLVSILIPAFNAERWLARSIASALAQTWGRIEVVIVDDGSTDSTLDIARRHECSNVIVRTQPNAGAASARNAALDLAQGDYIQWLDADDILHNSKIEHQLARADSRAKLLTSCWGRFFDRPDRARFAPDPLWTTLRPVDWISRKFSFNASMVPASWLVSRALAHRAGAWDTRLSLDDDGEYMCRLVAASDRVEFVPSARCYYRVGNTGSLSWRKSESAVRSACLSIELCVAHLLKLEDSAATRAACLTFVQEASRLFHPGHTDLIDRCRTLASALGGNLQPPSERAHFRLFRSAFGWERAASTRAIIDRSRMSIARLTERCGGGSQPSSP